MALPQYFFSQASEHFLVPTFFFKLDEKNDGGTIKSKGPPLAYFTWQNMVIRRSGYNTVPLCTGTSQDGAQIRLWS